MPFEIVRNDITKMDTDAIVNAANTRLQAGGGVCGAIFAAAGHERLQQACSTIGHCRVGDAVITPGFGLAARYVIHAVGPIWQGGGQREDQLLRSCYRRALELARKKRCRSIAFPLISAGIYGYPRREALEIAVETIRSFLQEHEMHVVLVLFDRSALELAESRLGQIRRYIDDNYVDVTVGGRRRDEPEIWQGQAAEQAAWAQSRERPAPPPQFSMPVCAAAPAEKVSRSLGELVNNLEESFSRMLLRLIDERGLTDVEVYKRANLDRKLFSKLRKDGYNPGKPTVLALAIALELNLDQTRDLLAKAGYALSPCSKFDVIVRYFIQMEIYDIYEVNQALFAFEQRLLGA